MKRLIGRSFSGKLYITHYSIARVRSLQTALGCANCGWQRLETVDLIKLRMAKFLPLNTPGKNDKPCVPLLLCFTMTATSLASGALFFPRLKLDVGIYRKRNFKK